MYHTMCRFKGCDLWLLVDSGMSNRRSRVAHDVVGSYATVHHPVPSRILLLSPEEVSAVTEQTRGQRSVK